MPNKYKNLGTFLFITRHRELNEGPLFETQPELAHEIIAASARFRRSKPKSIVSNISRIAVGDNPPSLDMQEAIKLAIRKKLADKPEFAARMVQQFANLAHAPENAPVAKDGPRSRRLAKIKATAIELLAGAGFTPQMFRAVRKNPQSGQAALDYIEARQIMEGRGINVQGVDSVLESEEKNLVPLKLALQNLCP